jgi:methyl-accepting chemotaxis protein
MAMEVSYTMDDAMTSLDSVNSNITAIQKITKQMNILALNAMIEANQAGEAGKGFEVVAEEVKQVASQIANVSKDIQSSIKHINDDMIRNHDKLRDMATTDMSDYILSTKRLEKLTGAMTRQNESFKNVLTESAEETEAISTAINKLTMSLQFQDRVSQYLDNSRRAVSSMREELEHQPQPGDHYAQNEHARQDATIAIDTLLDKLSLFELRNMLRDAIARDPSLADMVKEQGDVMDTADAADDGVELF